MFAHRSRRPSRTALHRSLIMTLLTTLVASMTWLGASPAAAAGDGVLDVAIRPIAAGTGNVITEIADGEHSNRITYEVQYSCGDSACDDATVQLSPSQPDPYGLLAAGNYLIRYEAWNAPSAGGTISGNDVSGKLISLGDLAPGDAGTFTVTYKIERNYVTPIDSGNHSGNDVPYGSFYPDGFQIEMSATIDSATATGPVTEDASDVTWHIGVASGPAANVFYPATIRTGEDTTVALSMNTGNMISGAGGNITGLTTVNAAGSYQVVYHVPEEATVVDTRINGVHDPLAVVDNVAHTITWTMGSAADPVYGARGGWGLNGNGGWNGGGAAPDNVAGDPDTQATWRPRQVILNFDGAAFDEADANDCNFVAAVDSSVDVSVTYLDKDRTHKSTSVSKAATVACTDAFGGLRAEKFARGSGNNVLDGNISSNPYSISALNVPGPGQADRTGPFWRIAVSNRGNVPAVAVIEDDTISFDHIKVDELQPIDVGMTIEWTAVDDGGTESTGTVTLADGQTFPAPAGTWFTAVRATTEPIAPGRVQPSDNTESWAYLDMSFTTDNGAVEHLGEQRFNNAAHVELTYPDFGDAGQPPIYEPWASGDTTRTPLTEPLTADPKHALQYTTAVPDLAAAFVGDPVVAGGGNPAPGTEVTYEMRATTAEVWPGTQIIPQLAFIAPVGWDVVPGSAEMAAGAPAGVTFQYATKIIAGVERQVVVATWPSAIAPSTTGAENWPSLSVTAKPTSSASTVTNDAVATVWAGDASGTWSDAVGVGYNTDPGSNQFNASRAVVDIPDIDTDINQAEEFSSADSPALTVAASSLLSVVKEICVPDAQAADGCDWVADSSTPQVVPVNADDVKYRITVRNGGNASMSDVVAYDVLPYPGDTGLLESATPRGSQFAMSIGSIESVSAGTELTFSASTNPSRPEVNPGASGTVDDWSTDAAGKQAIRIAVDGTMAPGDEKSVVLVAAVDAGAEADQLACNTVAVDSAQTLPAEPQAVCLQLAEADLQIELSDLSDLYPDTSRTLDYTVTNLGGSDNAPATVQVSIPEGVSVTDLDVDGWSCAVSGGGSAPVAGDADLDCVPVDGNGDPRTLALATPSALVLPIDVDADATGDELCFPASVTGPLYDPVLLNNLATGCRALAQPDVPDLRAVKSYDLTDDSITPDEADEGDTVTYTFEVYNDGPGTAHDVSIDDDLPGLSAVSPTSVDIAEGSMATFTATYVVTGDDAQDGSVENSATASFTPPTPPGGSTPPARTTPPSNLVVVPVVIAEPELTVTKTVDPDTGTVVSTDDQLTYTLTFQNTGYIDAPVDYMDDLSGVLDDATVLTGPSVDDGLLVATLTGDDLDITGTLEPDESETVRYTVQVRPRAERGDDTLSNFLLTGTQQPPVNGACDPSGTIPCTANPVAGDIDVTKAVDADGEVKDGQTVTYTLRIVNTGLNDGTVDLLDHLDNVLDDAGFGEIVDDGGLTVERDGDLLRITGTLGGEEVTEVVYTVKAEAGAKDGDGMLLNAVAGNGVVVDLASCDDNDPRCTLTPVAPPPGALPDTGSPLGMNGLLGGLGLVILGGALMVASRASAGRHAA